MSRIHDPEWWEDKNLCATVLLYMDGKAIAEDKDGNLGWMEIPEEYAEPGEAVEAAYLQPLSDLPPEQETAIRQEIEQMPADLLAVLRGGSGHEDVL